MVKAYKIKTTQDEFSVDFFVYGAATAGKAKTLLLNSLQDAYPQATYAWIKSCKRCPGWDFIDKTGCLEWQMGNEHWNIVQGHWYG